MILITIDEMDELRYQALKSLINSEKDFCLLNDKKEHSDTTFPLDYEAAHNDTQHVHICKLNEEKPNEALEMLEQSIEREFPAGTLVLLDSDDPQLKNRIMRLGNTGIARTCARKSELVALIRACAAGYTSSPPETELSKAIRSLTPEEDMIVRLACKGLSRKELAAELALSESSIKRSISRILATTGYLTLNKLALDAISEKAINPHLLMERQWPSAELRERDIRYYHACDQ